MSRSNAFSGVALRVHPVPDRSASAFYSGRLFRNQTQSQGFGPAHTAIRLSSCIFFRTGELDGAEGIDGAKT
jgi:hypothetical protein